MPRLLSSRLVGSGVLLVGGGGGLTSGGTLPPGEEAFVTEIEAIMSC